jgi:phosphate transport system protein
MLREIIAIWKGQAFMKKVVEEFGEMLSNAEYVFTQAWAALTGRADIKEVKKPLYEKDGAVNRGEREIRRKILEHLSINPIQDVSGCLAMISLVKDVERIGDYSKNIFEVGIMMNGTTKNMKYMKRFAAMQKKLADNFPKLHKAFIESDENTAKLILNDYKPIKDECNILLHDLFSESMPTKEAVATVLLSRYLKRINSHMSNIASGIIYPLDRIDFVRGGLLE